MHPVNPFLTAAQNIPGLPQQIHAEIIHCVTNIDINSPAAGQEYTDYVRNLIRTAVEGDDSGGQGLNYIVDVVGNELAALSFIHTHLEQQGTGVLTVEEVPIPDLPLMQHEGVGRGVTASHHLIAAWNHAVTSGHLDSSQFTDIVAVQDNLSNLANDLSNTRNALVALFELLSQLP